MFIVVGNDTEIHVQILDEAVCVLRSGITLGEKYESSSG